MKGNHKPIFGDAVIVNLIRILQPLRRNRSTINAAENLTQADMAWPRMVEEAERENAELDLPAALRHDMEKWARIFIEGRSDQRDEHTRKKDLNTFADMCADTAVALQNLALHPALSGESSARWDLAEAFVEGGLSGDVEVEGALRERFVVPLIGLELALIQAEAVLTERRSAVQALAGDLRILSNKARAAAAGNPSAGRGKPRDDAKLNSTIELITIFERHALTRATRINDGSAPTKSTRGRSRPVDRSYGAFVDFARVAFRAVGEGAPTARVQQALNWYATYTKSGDE